MTMPDLLATPHGRLVAFFALYVTEGLPQGFVATAVATQLRRQGVGVTEIAAFVGASYLPWAFKWVMGPLVDIISFGRLGHRRGWIILMQGLMVATLLLARGLAESASMTMLIAIVLVHNCFAATQDVAIDSLAVSEVPQRERGTVNGMMFSGAYLGQGIGGAGALLVAPFIGFAQTYYLVAAVILAVTLLVAVPLCESPGEAGRQPAIAGIGAAISKAWEFALTTWRAFADSRSARVAILFALLPTGASALGLSLYSTLAVDLGLGDVQLGRLASWSTFAAILASLGGGWLSDRIGRRAAVATFAAATVLPTLWLSWSLWREGLAAPFIPAGSRLGIDPHPLMVTFWWTTLAFAALSAAAATSSTALLMDLTSRRVAATQLTLYLALPNLVSSYSSIWQGRAVERMGYPLTLVADSLVGLVSLALLPLMVAAATKRQNHH
jgi:PAT family beta-lactamase induction signal transducer AmpG